MKTKYLLLFCLLSFSSALEAQSYRNDASKKMSLMPRSKKRIKEKVYNPNVVKFNMSGLLFKSLGVQYEHRLSRKTTWSLGLIYRPMGKWAFSRYFDTVTTSTGVSQETKFMYANSRYRSLMITPEFRYFIGHHTPRGFYVSAFARFKFDRTNFKYHYQNNVSSENVGDASLFETAMGGGLMFGYQIMSTKHLAIDFWFLGPWIGNLHTNLRSDVDVSKMSTLQQTFASQAIKDWFGKDEEVRWDSKGIATKFNQFYFTTRLIGINIGYSF